MKYIKLRLKTTTEAVDLVGSMLADLGIEGIEIEDCIPLSEEDKKRMFIDILPELPPDDGTAYVSFYAETTIDYKSLSKQIEDGMNELSTFADVGEASLEISETEDKDWLNNWKHFFKPFRLDDNIIIKPTWEKLDNYSENDIIVEIDPGTAFGTGSHETTKLCINGLKKYLKKGDSLLDIGCGSGILSIIGKKLEAAYVAGVDIDSNAVGISAENTGLNNIKCRLIKDAEPLEHSDGYIDFIGGNVIEDTALRKQIGYKYYDVVAANILADIIIPLSEIVNEFMKPDAIFISSGIINTKEEAVKQALVKNGFGIIEICRMGDWVSIAARLNK